MLISTLIVLTIAAGAVIAFFADGQTAPRGCDW